MSRLLVLLARLIRLGTHRADELDDPEYRRELSTEGAVSVGNR